MGVIEQQANLLVKGNFMPLANYIEEGLRRVGNRPALAQALAVSPSQVTNAKDRGLPVSACYALADLIGADTREIIAESELVTERRPERRAILEKALTKFWRARNDSNVRPLPSEGSTLSS